MENNAPMRIKPARGWYGLSIAIFLLGPLAAAYLIYSIFASPLHSITFYVPGTASFYIPQSGYYTLWTETADRPTSSITFINQQTKQKFSLQPSIGWQNTNLKPITSHYALGSGYFDAGNYQVSATSQAVTPYKVYLRQPSLPQILRSLMFAFILTVLGVLVGILSAIIILIKRINARNNMQTTEQKPLSTSATNSKDATWAMIIHLSGFVGFLLPLTNIIAPLIIWGIKHHESLYLDEQGKEAINFQISITIYYLISLLLILGIIGLFLLPLLAAFQIVAMIIASIECANGKPFRYPLTIRFLR